MRRLTRYRVRALPVAAIVAAGLAAGAFAYWMANGSGSASTVLPSPQQLTLEAGTPQPQLAPGHPSSVAVVATNANSYFVHIDSLALNAGEGTGGFDVDAGHSGCDPSVLGFTPQNNGGAGWSVPPKVASTDGTLAFEIGEALTMGASAANACQGATFIIHLTAGA